MSSSGSDNDGLTSSDSPYCSEIANNGEYFYVFSVVIPDIISSLINLILTYILYHTVEIGHPQFAIIFQNHCIGNLVNFLSLSLHVLNLFYLVPCFTTVYVLVNFNALQFHFISWLAVALMRLYFISNQQNSVHLSKVKKCAFAFVWVYFVSLKVCNNVVLGISTPFITRIVFYVTMISPAVFCIVIYFALRIKLRVIERLEIQQHQNRLEENQPQNELEVGFEEEERKKLKAKFHAQNSTTLISIELNVIIAGVMIAYGIFSEALEPSIFKAITYGLFLMVMKNAIPVATGITTSRKIQQGIRQYFEPFMNKRKKVVPKIRMELTSQSTPSSSLLSWYKCETTKGTINDD